jgi:ribosomal-protein-alanine N-acetyltransferase
VGLRPIRLTDAGTWRQLRQDNLAWLAPWEATRPPGAEMRPTGYRALVRDLQRQARRGTSLPFVITWDGGMVGQLTISGITWGSARWAHMGYWIDEGHAGLGIMPTAVALATDHCFMGMGLHRMEIAIRPENVASLRVVEKLGFSEIGLAPRFLHIDGEWRDHRIFALTSEEVPDGLSARLR